MQNQNLAVLIFAQSGRLLAQSATQAGYRVWVADCFGDMDTRASCERYCAIPPLSNLTEQQFLAILDDITQGEPCNLIYGSGVEHCYSLLNSLPTHIKLIGNSFSTVEQVKIPRHFFSALDDLQLPYPTTVFSQQELEKNYIAKSAAGLGGSHIKDIAAGLSENDYYFQQKIMGQSGSILFLADGNRCHILSINKQFLAPTLESPYQLGMIETPWLITKSCKNKLYTACELLTEKLNLLGLNSLDFIISDEDQLFLLEVNPRPSASAELLSKKLPPLIQLHIDAYNGILPETNYTKPSGLTNLRYLFSQQDLVIPNTMNWPKQCHDLPPAGQVIKKNEPICSCLVETNDHNQALDQHSMIEQKVYAQLKS